MITRAKTPSIAVLLSFFSFAWLNWESTVDSSFRETMVILSTMSAVRFCYGPLIVRCFLFFTRSFTLRAPWIVASPIFAAAALFGAAIKSSDILFKKPNPRWIASTTLLFPTSPSPLTYRSNCLLLSQHWHSLLLIAWLKTSPTTTRRNVFRGSRPCMISRNTIGSGFLPSRLSSISVSTAPDISNSSKIGSNISDNVFWYKIREKSPISLVFTLSLSGCLPSRIISCHDVTVY